MYCKLPLTKIKKIALVTTNCKKTIAQVKATTGAQYVINGSLYNFNTCKPLCKFRADGKTMANAEDGYWMYAWNVGPDIKMIHSNDMEKYQNGIACIAMLKDGKNTILSYGKGVGGSRPRSAIGLTIDGKLVLYCTKSNQTIEQVRTIMRGYGCVSAICLDGGGSASCDFDGQKVTTTRKVANYICVWTETPSTKTETPVASTCPYAKPAVTVKRGNVGSGVKWVQWHLKQTVSPSLAVDGVFGSGTMAAVKTFQSKYSLAADGIVGPATQAKMLEVCHG